MAKSRLTQVVAGVRKTFAFRLGKFKLGDLVDSSGCEKGRPYMPGTGEIISIRPDNSRPFACEHDGKLYYFSASEIKIAEMYQFNS